MAILSAGGSSLRKTILNMIRFLETPIGRLRLAAFLEGLSLLILIFIAVPLKHFFNEPKYVQLMGPVHGAIFLVFVFGTVQVGIEHRWRFKEVTWKVLLACFIPFGTFYIDYKILRKLDRS